MTTVLIAAVARNGVIGAAGALPWHIPDDLKRFKRLTMGQALIMGRTTFESIGRALPGRSSIVLTRRASWSHDGVATAGSLESALEMVRDEGLDAYVAGGAEVYRSALDRADRLELTDVHLAPNGDTWFPPVDWTRWTESLRERHQGYEFVTFDRPAHME